MLFSAKGSGLVRRTRRSLIKISGLVFNYLIGWTTKLVATDHRFLVFKSKLFFQEEKWFIKG